ncbi:WD40 repeat protein, partial [Spiromyces aspiralis]
KGIVIGIDQEWLLVDRGIVGVSKLSVKAKLFVHSILDHMLGDDAGHDALMYASCFEHLPYFPHCLEVLLHTVLEREADALPRVSGGQVILPKVIELLQNFDGFLDVVTRCARKTEMSLWPRLFAVVGGPLACFERCLEMGHLRTATQLLIVVYNLEPDTTACRRAVLRLLDMAVARQDRDLCVELARFLQQSAESDKPGNNGDKSPLLELFQTLQAMPAL